MPIQQEAVQGPRLSVDALLRAVQLLGAAPLITLELGGKVTELRGTQAPLVMWAGLEGAAAEVA